MVSYNSILDIDITTWPNTEPVSLSEAKDFCRIDIGTDDNIILALITAARQQCEAYTNIAFAEYEMTVVLNNENGETLLPYGPLITILQVTDEDDLVHAHLLQGIDLPLKARRYRIEGAGEQPALAG